MRLEMLSEKHPYRSGGDLRQRALDTAITEINRKTDLDIALESLERSKHRRVTTLTFSINGGSEWAGRHEDDETAILDVLFYVP